MAWISTGTPGNPHWILTSGKLGVKNTLSVDYLYQLKYQSTSKTFLSSKTYQAITDISNFYSPGLSFSLTIPDGGEVINYESALGLLPSSPGNGYLYHYTTPPTNITTTDYSKYLANSNFGVLTSPTEGIGTFSINELNWSVQGFSWFKKNPLQVNAGDALGWVYDSVNNTYLWEDSSNAAIKQPAGGAYGQKSAPVDGYRYNNYIARFINYSFFNISFYYQKYWGNANDGVSIYLSNTLPSPNAGITNSAFPGTLIATMSMAAGTGTFSAFYGLQGGQYIYLVGSKTSATTGTTASFVMGISNIKIEGGYHSGNNSQYLMTNSASYSNPTVLTPLGLSGATYSAYSGYGNTVNATSSLTIFQINALIGNGNFKAGIWENGVWNSGWRDDNNMYEFYSIGSFFDYNRGKQWRFIINGPESSVNKFNVGDKVSIGNIVAIDINEDRKLIKSYFTVISVSTTSIIVELTNNFPLRRIQIDSEGHRIYVTKNVWLSGAFLNGYFNGIWNYGLFKGYPMITEMENTHWVDGIFDGGHYKADQIGSYFTDTVFTPPSGQPGEGPKVGLTFSSPHRLNTGDNIYISKDNIVINPQYNGWTTVTSVVNEYQLVVDIEWGSNSTNESGWVYTHISNGVIQNFDFRSNNISTITSVQSMDSNSVFIYNSWIDVNYSNSSAVSIGKSNFLSDSLSRRPYTENNLYGYPTYDVLASVSSFRDSYSLKSRSYKLGTKYRIFNDYIGDSSTFEDYFGATGPDSVLFLDQGWTYSISQSLTFSRTIDTGVETIIGEELKVDAVGSGGVLNTTTTDGILNRTNENIEKGRYTVVEFDLITYSVYLHEYQNSQSINGFGTSYKGGPKNKAWGPNIVEPVIHFNNINKVTRNVLYVGAGGTTNSVTPYPSGFPGIYLIPGYAQTVIEASYLPIYQNIDHLSTVGYFDADSTKKQEYFYNKRDLSMYFRGSGLYGASQSSFTIDNLKLYEIDMVPFFSYFTEDNINKGIQVPYQGIAPFIDYTNSNFSFIDNISIGLSSIQTQQSFVPFSGVGIGIGVGSGIGSGTELYQQSQVIEGLVGG